MSETIEKRIQNLEIEVLRLKIYIGYLVGALTIAFCFIGSFIFLITNR